MVRLLTANRPILRSAHLLVILLIAFCLPPSPAMARESAQPSEAPQSGESLVVPFRGGWQAATTGNSYAGLVTVTVSGIGQASGTAYTDAFYVLTDYAGHPVPPTVPNAWTLAINGGLAKLLIPGQQVPAYRGDHTYTFPINAPGGRLTFGVADGYTADNTGSYAVSIAGGGSSCSVVPISQQDKNWINWPLRTNPTDNCSAEYSTIGAGGCALTSATMLFVYYGASLTPPQLSDCMSTDACLFHWDVAANCSGGKAHLVPSYDYNSLQQLDVELNNNKHPVILGMHMKTVIKGQDVTLTHYVLAISGHGTDAGGYLVDDPAPLSGGNTNLGTLTREGWVPDQLVVYSGVPACSTVAGRPTEVRKPAQPPTPSSPNTVDGSVWLWHANETSLVVQVAASSSAGQVTEMQVWTDSHPSSGWSPFSEFTWVMWEPGDSIHAVFRDEAGNVSNQADASLYPVVTEPIAQQWLHLYLPAIVR
jgi:hypothetical protein